MPNPAHTVTTNHTGSFHTIKAATANRAKAKSLGFKIALAQTGSYKVANNKPTVDAFTAISADCTVVCSLNRSQNGNAPTTRKKDGKKIATKASKPPTQPVGDRVIDAPKNAAKVNKGPVSYTHLRAHET